MRRCWTSCSIAGIWATHLVLYGHALQPTQRGLAARALHAVTGEPPALSNGTATAAPGLQNPTSSADEAAEATQERTYPELTPKAWMPVTPEDSRWQNSIALCTAIRDENSTDIREFLSYYRWLGFDHVYVTENDSKHPVGHALQDFIESGFLTYRKQSGKGVLQQAFNQCFKEGRKLFNWMAFFDSDEILVVRERNVTVKQLLNDFKRFAGLMVHWIVVGPNNRRTRPREGGMLRAYTQCAGEPAGSGKLIANLYYMAGPATLHTARFRNHMAPVDERRTPFPYEPHKPYPTKRMVPAYADRVALFHYIVKSLEDFQVKIARGGDYKGRGGHRIEEFDDIFMRIANQTGGICAEPALLADMCCPETRPW